ncbi:Associated molecule with the SH3 domain of STAM 3 isoform 1 [Theobroma cacao]|uniref:Associated molecule with the SH3 domain of STAM 3 isoform 1 n=1 Tax=Theobroma cacao TaxID=3641 RepID=A0A061EPW6_THECC|nr:Associated molecule with the SH3 domain of STAM 3 isoform 1 [Theobroma cacao]EOY06663.1 Associated molecule with the SH3 domain of STAM 3 isoform 1 [Theobroma cacao]
MKIDVNAMARRVEVDNRIPLRYYYRIADNLLKQASIYRDEKNIVDLYIILLRYSSLVSETIPFHRDYQVLLPKEKAQYRKRLLAVLDELESSKPEVHRRVEELNKSHAGARLLELDGHETTSYGSEKMSPLEWSSVNNGSNMSLDIEQPANMAVQSSWKYNNDRNLIDKQFQKLSLPFPNKETLSRHSFLGPDGLRGQWLGPRAEIKVQYPSSMDLVPAEKPGPNQAGQYGALAVKDGDPGGVGSAMESVLSLDDGRWLHPAEESCHPLISEAREDPFQFVGIRQPSPPPVLARVQQDFTPIPPSKVADPRPGPAKASQDGMPNSNSYQHLHVPVHMMEDFLRLARANTEKNLETCGVLAGSLKNRVFHITTLIIPKQESTSDSCSTLNEEEIFEVQDKLSLFPLGWIHTHPTQTCFMSSVDLHTHYSYQIMLPEAIAIVMAPTDTSSPHGIFHLSDPGGVSIIRNCQQRGFHPHEEPSDGSPIYEHCSHVFMNPKIKFDVVDLR